MLEANTPISPETNIPERPMRRRSGFLLPLLIVGAGALWLGMIAGLEALWLARQPWSGAILATEEALADPDVLTGLDEAMQVRVRLAGQPGAEAQLLAMVDEALGGGDAAAELLYAPEWVVAAPVSSERLSPLLASGRLPRPGKHEVLAGALAKDAPFKLDGTEFTVTGRMHDTVGALFYAYMLPQHPNIQKHFTDGKAQKGWLHPNGVHALRKTLAKQPEKAGEVLEQKAETAPETDEARSESPGSARPVFEDRTVTPAPFAWGTLLGLLAMAVGGTLFYWRVSVRLATDRVSPFGRLFAETVRRRRLFLGAHLVMYAVFFGFMGAGLLMPQWGYQMTRYMTAAFTEGGLSYIGEAYASGNILSAAGATFLNNYIVQTLGLTYLASLAVPLAPGLFKTAASFAVVGFAMAPTWAGTASGMTFHGITMVLEMEGYILASFVVVLWPVYLVRAALGGGRAAVAHGLRLMLLGAVVSGVILAFAALYEAATLIILRPLF